MMSTSKRVLPSLANNDFPSRSAISRTTGGERDTNTLSRMICQQLEAPRVPRVPHGEVAHRAPTHHSHHESLRKKDSGVSTERQPKKKSSSFPENLYTMLTAAEECGLNHVVSWKLIPPDKVPTYIAPHAVPRHPCYAFQILEMAKFENEVLPKFFKTRRYKSFQRNLNLHKFIRIQEATYMHAYMQRGRPDLYWHISRPTQQREGIFRSGGGGGGPRGRNSIFTGNQENKLSGGIILPWESNARVLEAIGSSRYQQTLEENVPLHLDSGKEEASRTRLAANALGTSRRPTTKEGSTNGTGAFEARTTAEGSWPTVPSFADRYDDWNPETGQHLFQSHSDELLRWAEIIVQSWSEKNSEANL